MTVHDTIKAIIRDELLTRNEIRNSDDDYLGDNNIDTETLAETSLDIINNEYMNELEYWPNDTGLIGPAMLTLLDDMGFSKRIIIQSLKQIANEYKVSA